MSGNDTTEAASSEASGIGSMASSRHAQEQEPSQEQAFGIDNASSSKHVGEQGPKDSGALEKSIVSVPPEWAAADHQGLDLDLLAGKLEQWKGMKGSKQSHAGSERSASLTGEHGDSPKADLQGKTAFVTAMIPPAYKNPANPHRFERAIPRARPAAKASAQNAFIESIAKVEINEAAMPPSEGDAREELRIVLRKVCRNIVTDAEGLVGNKVQRGDVQLMLIGSMNDGLGLKNSDLDLLLVAPKAQCLADFKDANLPRYLARELLDGKLGVHVFTSLTGDVSIRGCKSPTPVLLDILNRKWAESDEKAKQHQADELLVRSYRKALNAHFFNVDERARVTAFMAAVENSEVANGKDPEVEARREELQAVRDIPSHFKEREPRRVKIPEDMGIRFNIQFRNPLGLFNAKLLRCYSLCDLRFRQMVVFVRAWAKKRDVSSPSRGTLSHYGYLLMVLHFCINIASPPLFPNLQQAWKRTGGDKNMVKECAGYDVRFWGHEEAIAEARDRGKLSYNDQSLALLIREFFHYYSGYPGLFHPPFHWRDQVVAVKEEGGLVSKKELGWVEAKIKQIRPAYNRDAEPVVVRTFRPLPSLPSCVTDSKNRSRTTTT